MLFEEKYARALAQDPQLAAELQDVNRAVREAEEMPVTTAAEKRARRDARWEARRRARSLEIKLRKVPTPERLVELERFKSLATGELSALEPEQIERVLAFHPDVQKMKGQILEELLNTRMADPAERALAAGEKGLEAARRAGAELEF